MKQPPINIKYLILVLGWSSVILASCNQSKQDVENTNSDINSQTSTTESINEDPDPYLTGCPTYLSIYDYTERVSKNESNRFVGIYGFIEGDTLCLDHLYEETNNLVPPDTNIVKQNTYFINVKSREDFKPVTNLKQLLRSGSLKQEVIATDNLMGDNLKLYPFRK